MPQIPDIPRLEEPIHLHVQRNFSFLRAESTVGESLAVLRTSSLTEQIIYFYVIDKNEKLVGVVPTRRLLMTQPQENISAIMSTNVTAIPCSATVLEACEYFTQHRFLAFPVIDEEDRMIGVVDINLFTDETITTVERQQSERAFQLLGVHVALGRKVSSWRSFRDRFPWLLCNIGGGIICALIASRFESLLESAFLLALFIPVVLALSESVSMQSMTITLVGLEHQRIHWPRLWVNLRKEFVTASLLGLFCGFVVALIATAWRGFSPAAVAIGLSIYLAVITSCLLGVAIPTAARAFIGNPRIAAGPIVLAIADIATLTLYFTIAGMLLSH